VFQNRLKPEAQLETPLLGRWALSDSILSPAGALSTSKRKARWPRSEKGSATSGETTVPRCNIYSAERAVQGLMTLRPAASNGLVSRVATVNPRAATVAAM